MKIKQLFFNVFFLGIFVSTLIYSPFILDFTITPRLISISFVLLICLLIIYQTKEVVKIKMDVILIFYLLYSLFCCLSIIWSNTKSESIFEGTKVLTALSVFLLSYYVFKKNKEDSIVQLSKISILIFGVELLLVAYQISHLANFNKQALYNIYGFNSHKNLVSSYLFLNFFFLILGSIYLKKVWRLSAIVGLVFSIVIIAFLQTKAVWIGFLVSVLLFVFFLFYKRISIKINFKISILLCLICANIFFVFFLPKIINSGINYNSTLDKNISIKTELDNERLILWDKTYFMINNHKLVGVGLGNWQINFPNATLKGLYRAEDLNYTFQRPHNDLLWILAETGLIGFNLFLIFIFSILILLIQTLKKVKESKSLSVELILCFVTIVGFFSISFFDFPKERIEHIIWINIILAYSYFLVKEHLGLYAFYNFVLDKKTLSFFIIGAFVVLLIGGYRYKGEYYTKQLYDQKNLKNQFGILKAADNAQSFAYKIDPFSIPLKWYTGNANASVGNYTGAITELLEALALNPYNRNVLNDLGSAYISINQIELGTKYYLESSRVSPRFDDPKLNLVSVYINQKQFAKADSCLNTLYHDSEKRTNYQKMVNAFLGK